MMGLFSGSGNIFDKIGQLFTDPKAAWDEFKTGGANKLNADIAEQNLEYQKERNAIEDERYAEETAYNREFAENERDYQREFAENERDYQRAFAEEERDYNRALQQQLFEREDTALERQAESLSKMGINPLSQQMSGLGAGSVISSGSTGASSAPGAVSAPGASSRGGSALNNQMQVQNMGIEGALSALSGLASVMNGVSTGQYQRDSLALQNDRMYLENLALARKNGIDYIGPEIMKGANYRNAHWIDKSTGTEFYNDEEWKRAKGSQLSEERRTNREFFHMLDADMYDTDSAQGRLIKDLGNLDFVHLAENILTRGATLTDNIGEKFNKDFGVSKTLKNFFSLFY